MRRLARTDLFFLLWFACGRKDMEHPWLLARCKEVEASPNGHLDLWARDHYKSTIITFGQSIQDVLSSHGEDPDPKWNGIEVTIGILSHTGSLAKNFLEQIKRELEANAILKAAFPDVLWENPHKDSPKWSVADGIIVRRKGNPKESTIEAGGLVEGQPTGKHFFIRVYDDVVTEASVSTAEQIKKTTKAWENSLALGSARGLSRYIGTRYDDGDTYGAMMERDAVKPRIYAATDDGTAAGRPVLLSQEGLDEKRAMGPYTFSCQMLQNPIPDNESFFQKDWFQWYEPGELPALNLYGTSDYAVTDGGGDFTELGIDGIDVNGNIYLAVDYWYGQTSSEEWIERQIDQMEKFKPFTYFNEAGVIRRSMEGTLKKRMEERKVYCHLEWISPVTNKTARARALQARASGGKVFLPNNPHGQRILEQLCRFPRGKYDDAVDRASLFAMVIDQTHPAIVKGAKKVQKKDCYDRAFERQNEAPSWKAEL